MPPSRSRFFRERTHNRYWWYRLSGTDYVPPVYAALTDAEWALLDAWFEETERLFPSPGELSIPGISFLNGLIGGSAISAIVQCGHYVGYSTLMLGMLLRHMGKKNALYSIDIDADVTAYTQKWVDRAGLGEEVKLCIASSSAPHLPDAAREYFARAPELVFIDSSHQYAHTLEELDLWYGALAPGGFIMMHDVSVFAQSFDASSGGGVLRAVNEWSARQGAPLMLLNSFVDGSQSLESLSYRDGCGMGLIQKPM